jgi:hypothetical protein
MLEMPESRELALQACQELLQLGLVIGTKLLEQWPDIAASGS